MNDYSKKLLHLVTLLLDELADTMDPTPPPPPSVTLWPKTGAGKSHTRITDFRLPPLPDMGKDEFMFYGGKSACECERWRDGITVCPVHGTTKPEPVVTYTIPGPPPTEHKVTNGSFTWIRQPDGLFKVCAKSDRLVPGVDSPFLLDDPCSWIGLLIWTSEPLTLVPWTDEEKAEHALYGPPGARWGHPNEPCPYWRGDPTRPASAESCALGRGHIGPHQDKDGAPLGETAEADTYTTANVTPQEAAETPCLCGNPAEHQPGCPRYARITGQGAHPPMRPAPGDGRIDDTLYGEPPL